MQFKNTWLSRYPRHMNVIHDQGGEFTGHKFLHRLQVNNVNSRPTISKNPQANSVCERMHQTIGNTLQVLSTLNPPEGVEQAEHLVDTAIADAVYATRCTYHGTLKTTPGGLAFSRDMILNLPLVTDLQQLQKRRQEIIDKAINAASIRRDFPTITRWAMKSFGWRIGQTSWSLELLVRTREPKFIPMGLFRSSIPLVSSKGLTYDE
jgi:hypothetical protein